MMKKACFLFLCILLISGLFLPSTAAGRALLETTETEGRGGNGGSKMGVTGSHSKTASSRTEFSSPSKPSGSQHITYSALQRPPVCSARVHGSCVTPKASRATPCSYYNKCKRGA